MIPSALPRPGAVILLFQVPAPTGEQQRRGRGPAWDKHPGQLDGSLGLNGGVWVPQYFSFLLFLFMYVSGAWGGNWDTEEAHPHPLTGGS